MRTYDFSTAITGVVQATGRFVRYVEGDSMGGDPTIVIRPERGGSSVEMRPGDHITFDEPSPAFAIRARGPDNVVGKLLIGNGSADSSSVLGVVEVVDGGKQKTIRGIAFQCQIGVPAVAAQYSHASLHNPAGSGKNLVVSAVRISSSVAGRVALGGVAVELAISGGAAAAKLVKNGLSSTAVLRYEAKATPIASLGSLDAPYIAAGIISENRFDQPVIVSAGYGLMVRHVMVNAEIFVTYEFVEEAELNSSGAGA